MLIQRRIYIAFFMLIVFAFTGSVLAQNPTPDPGSPPNPEGDPCILSPSVEDTYVFIRELPTTVAPVVSRIAPDLWYEVLEYTLKDDGEWYRIRQGWVAGYVTVRDGNCDAIYAAFVEQSTGTAEADTPPSDENPVQITPAARPQIEPASDTSQNDLPQSDVNAPAGFDVAGVFGICAGYESARLPLYIQLNVLASDEPCSGRDVTETDYALFGEPVSIDLTLSDFLFVVQARAISPDVLTVRDSLPPDHPFAQDQDALFLIFPMLQPGMFTELTSGQIESVVNAIYQLTLQNPAFELTTESFPQLQALLPAEHPYKNRQITALNDLLFIDMHSINALTPEDAEILANVVISAFSSNAFVPVASDAFAGIIQGLLPPSHPFKNIDPAGLSRIIIGTVGCIGNESLPPGIDPVNCSGLSRLSSQHLQEFIVVIHTIFYREFSLPPATV